jgi:hypothetical protein
MSDPVESAKTKWRSAMKQQDAGSRNSSVDQGCGIHNPYVVMDVPNPNDQEVLEFAAGAKLAGISKAAIRA